MTVVPGLNHPTDAVAVALPGAAAINTVILALAIVDLERRAFHRVPVVD
jgi:hypothetical protein